MESSVCSFVWRTWVALTALSIAATATVALEVTGVVQKVIPFPPRKVGVEGALIRFTSESNPQEFYSDSTDIYGNYRIDLGEQDTAVENEISAKPISFHLYQNYPNPFNPGTVISYQLPRAARAQVFIYNSIGQQVRALVDSYQELGSHAIVWDGRDNDGRALASGVYIYRLIAGAHSEARKMVLIDGPNSSLPGGMSALMGTAAATSIGSKVLTDLSKLYQVEGVPLPADVARKIAQMRSFVVTIDAYKQLPFQQAGFAVFQDTTLNFLMENYPREGVVFLKEGQRQLFLDDFNIEQMSNLKRTMHQPNKKGAVIRPNWPEWPATEAVAALQTRSAPFWDPLEKVFKLWLRDGSYRTSADGLHWVSGDEEYTGGEVFFDPLDPDPERRYKLFNPRRMAASPDGRNWTTLDVTITSSDEWNFSIDLENRLYIATVKQSGPNGRAVYLTTSKNFEDWTTPRLIFWADDLDQVLGRQNIEARLADESLLPPRGNDPRVYNVDAYNMGVFRYESVYLGMPALYHAVAPVPNYPNTDGFHLVQLAVSHDLRTWTRPGDRQPFIGPSKRDSGAYDLTQIIGPSNALVRGDELWFYYTGIKYRTAALRYVGTYPSGGWTPRPGFDLDAGAICLAVLRRDGFFSLDAAEVEGVVLTKPLVWRGSSLWVNASTEEGEVRVEVLDENGDLLRQGWSRAQSIAVAEDGVRLPVRWQSEEDLAELHQQTVRLRFYVRDAELYAFWTE